MARRQLALSTVRPSGGGMPGQAPAPGAPPVMDYQAQVQDIARRRAIAQQLAADQPRIEQAGGYVVPYSLGEGLAGLGKAFMARQQNKGLDAEQAAAQQQYQAGRAKVMQDLSSASEVTPDLADRAAQYGISPDVMNVLNPKPIAVPKDTTLIDPRTKQPVYTNASPDPLQHVSRDTGAEIQGGTFNPKTGEYQWGETTKKSVTPNQARESFTDQHAELLAAMAARGVTLPSGLRSKEQMRATLDGLIKKYPELDSDAIADNIATGKINFGAENKAAQIAGGQAGKVALGLNEINEFAPIVKDASSKVPRGSFMPLNRLLQASDAQLSDPNLRQLKIAVTSMLNAYDQVAARGGTDVGKREEAHRLLTSADSPEALNAAVAMFQREAEAAERAAQKTMKTVPANQKLPEGVTEDDISETMRANKMTRQQVLDRLNAR